MTLPDPQTRPMIQIDDMVREMTEEEHAYYLASLGTTNNYPTSLELPTDTPE